ncbi:MAG: hypothetical protein CSA76_04730 [Spirochaetales bacterium]|nr:MAG: hypothetical protein CSA76_04730 [Spirochaetales bacterium]
MKASLHTAAFVSFVALVFLGSCASTRTFQKQYLESRQLLERRDFSGAAELIEKYKNSGYRKKDRVLFYLDTGMLYHFAGEYSKSNEALSAAEEGMEELLTKSISKSLSSGFLNDNALAYSGEDYEDIYLNVFKCLNYIALEMTDDALVEVRKVQIKLKRLEDKYRKAAFEYNSSKKAKGVIPVAESRFHNDVLARYLSYLLYRLDNSPDDMRIEYEKLLHAFEDQPSIYPFLPPVFAEVCPEEETARLSVLSFTGLSPVKKPQTFYLTTIEHAVIINTSGQNEEYNEELSGFSIIPFPGVSAGYHYKLEYPVMVEQGSQVDRIVLNLGSQSRELSLIENMQAVSREIFMQRQPLVMGRTVIRTISKVIAKETGKSALRGASENDFLTLLLAVLMDVTVDLTENADLRTSRFFPAFAYGIDLNVPAGTYPFRIDYYGNGRLLFQDNRGMVNLKAEGLNLFESSYLE